jgi:hypothetical protein
LIGTHPKYIYSRDTISQASGNLEPPAPQYPFLPSHAVFRVTVSSLFTTITIINIIITIIITEAALYVLITMCWARIKKTTYSQSGLDNDCYEGGPICITIVYNPGLRRLSNFPGTNGC